MDAPELHRLAEPSAPRTWPSIPGRPTAQRKSSLAGYVQTENIYLSFNAEAMTSGGLKFMEFFLAPEAQAIWPSRPHPGYDRCRSHRSADAAAWKPSRRCGLPVIPRWAPTGPMDTALKQVLTRAPTGHCTADGYYRSSPLSRYARCAIVSVALGPDD